MNVISKWKSAGYTRHRPHPVVCELSTTCCPCCSMFDRLVAYFWSESHLRAEVCSRSSRVWVVSCQTYKWVPYARKGVAVSVLTPNKKAKRAHWFETFHQQGADVQWETLIIQGGVYFPGAAVAAVTRTPSVPRIELQHFASAVVNLSAGLTELTNSQLLYSRKNQQLACMFMYMLSIGKTAQPFVIKSTGPTVGRKIKITTDSKSIKLSINYVHWIIV